MISSFDADGTLLDLQKPTGALGVKVICIVLLLQRYFTLVVNSSVSF
jgi:hypothetical protein